MGKQAFCKRFKEDDDLLPGSGLICQYFLVGIQVRKGASITMTKVIPINPKPI